MIRCLSNIAAIIATAVVTSICLGQSSDDSHATKTPLAVAAPRPAASSVRSDPDKPPAPIIKLIEPGDKPRLELRYSFKKGTERTVSAVQAIKMQMFAGSQELPSTPVPTMKMVIQSSVERVGGNWASFERRILSGNVEAKGKDASMTRFKQMMEQAKSIRTAVQVNTRGIVQKVDVDTHGIQDPQVLEVVKAMKDAMSRSIIPLPAEAVGPGGKWQVTSSVDELGLSLTQRANYTVAKLTDREILLDVQMDLSAPPGKVALPGLPEGIAFELVEFMGKGNGSSLVEFSGFSPQGNLDSEISIKMRTSALPGQGNQTIELKMSTSLVIQPQP